jgi:FkbM family methyltransferase
MSDHRYVERKAGLYQSQHGEDRWLERYFGGKKTGFFVDVGAYDGIVISNTYYFEAIGWTGVLLEPNPAKAELCRRNRPGSCVFECAAVSSPAVSEVQLHDVPGGEVYSTVVANEFTAERLKTYGLSSRCIPVKARTLDSILADVSPAEIDFVSIDVEGAELEVLKGFDIKRWKPRLVMIESLTVRSEEVRSYFTGSGYVYMRSIDINDIYRPLPPAIPFGHLPAVAAAIDRLWYRANRAVQKAREKAREKVRLRTRLRQAGLWR